MSTNYEDCIKEQIQKAHETATRFNKIEGREYDPHIFETTKKNLIGDCDRLKRGGKKSKKSRRNKSRKNKSRNNKK